MLTRLTHAAIAFAVTAVLYQAYVLAVAPFIEPPPTVPLDGAFTTNDGETQGPASLNKYRELLAAYFPADHWCFARPPKTLESENRQVLAVFDGDQQSPSGVLTVPRCALLFFPKPRDRSAEPPRNAVILESSGGAVLQMAAQGKNATGFGRLQYGQLSGDVVVHSDMHEPGPGDDLRLTTRDIYINEDLIRTDQTVDLQLGEHRAFGRELELRWLKSEAPAATPGGLYGQFDDLVIKHDVSLIIAPGKLRFREEPPPVPSQGDPGARDRKSLTNGDAADHSNSPITKDAQPLASTPPIRIKSAGPFRIDFGVYKATFTDDVRAWQQQANGSRDELRAQELTLFFTKTTKWNDDGVTPTPGAGLNGMSFEPGSIQAEGKEGRPVELNAPTYEASARGNRLWIDLVNRRLSRVTLEGGDEVSLTHRGSEIRARTLQYTLPPPNSSARIGTLVASGSGQLLAIVDPARPNDLLEVAWREKMQVVRRNGQPVLILDGRPTVSLLGAGKLWADQLQLFLRELPAGADGQAGADALSSTIVPEAITASGRVAIDSPELTGQVNQLNIRVEQASPDPNGQSTSSTGGVASAPSSALAPSSFMGGNGTRRFKIEGIELQVDVALRNRRAQVRGLSVDGGVVFQEMPAAPAAASPMQIVAEHLKVTGADTPHAQIEISGGGGQDGRPLQQAEITARGATLRAPMLTINRGSNQAWVNSPGQVQLRVDRDMAGNPLPQPAPLDIKWQESMKLDGRRITFLGEVLVQHNSGWLNTRRLVLQTVQPVRFDGLAGSQDPQLDQIECWEGATAEFQQQDIGGVTSHQRMEMRSLIVNQVTGAIGGSGPGRIDSVHLAKGAGQLLALPQGGPQAPGLVQSQQQLRHLHIDFIRSVDGNLHSKTVSVSGDVQAIYGPVQAWDQRLTMTPGGNPDKDEVWITSDKLQVSENPMARLNNHQTRQVELMAEGKVTIEGQVPGQGAFTAYGHRAKYDQSKGNFILEGNGSTPATIEQQPFPGAPSSPQTAQRMLFNHITGHIKIEGLQQGQLNQIQP